jgi:hypothetical protein
MTRTAVLPDDALPRDGAAADRAPAPPATPPPPPPLPDGLHALAEVIDRVGTRLAAAVMTMAAAIRESHTTHQDGGPRP